MASKVPITKQIAWGAVLIQLGLLAALHILVWAAGSTRTFLVAPLIYLLWSIVSKVLLTKAHREGIQQVKAARFEEAINLFQESLADLEKRPWIDRYRAVVLLSPSAWSYREMAMVNIAFCHGQLGNGAECKLGYERVLLEYPQSTIATTALNMIRAAERIKAD